MIATTLKCDGCGLDGDPRWHKWRRVTLTKPAGITHSEFSPTGMAQYHTKEVAFDLCDACERKLLEYLESLTEKSK